MNDTPKIHLALAAIMQAVEPIAKAEENKGQGFFFRGIQTVMNELHPVFAANGVICMPSVKHAEHRDAGLTKNGSMQTRAIITCGFIFVAVDGSREEAVSIGEAIDSADKATGKAMSMALKYALTQTFLIPTADVVDADYYTPTVDATVEMARKTKDVGLLERLIKGHIEDAATADREDDKKRHLGLAAELRTELADLKMEIERASKPQEQPAAPAPAPTPEPEKPVAKTVETTVEPPPKPAPAPKPEPKTIDAAPASTPNPNISNPDWWKDVVCHLGKAGGTVNGKKLSAILSDKHSADHMASIYGYFEKQLAHLQDPTPENATLWKAVQAANDSWKRANQGGAAPTETAPATTEPAKAAATNWRDYVIVSKSPRLSGKKLGDLPPEDITLIRESFDKIDWQNATLNQRTLKARFALMDAEGHGAPTENVAPGHTRKLIDALTKSQIPIHTFLTECHKAGWIADGSSISAVTEQEASDLLADWKSVEAQALPE